MKTIPLFKRFKKKNLDSKEFIFPSRDPKDVKNFIIWLFILPLLITTIASLFLGGLLSKSIDLWRFGIIQFITLSLFLFFLWIPSFLAFIEWPDWLENSLILIRNAVLISVIIFEFVPYNH